MSTNPDDRSRCTRPVVLCIPCAVTEVIDTAARYGAILEATDHGLVVHGPLPPQVAVLAGKVEAALCAALRAEQHAHGEP